MKEARQLWDAEAYARNARFVSDLAGPVVDLLAPRPGERVLDLGCGDGALAVRLAAAGAEVVGVDGSEAMVAAARSRGLDARWTDAHALDFDSEFDAVFSNAALHWMRDPDRVIAGVARALRPGGRFAGEMGGRGCVASIIEALVAALERIGIDGRARIPWYFPGPDDYRARLERGGFAVEYIELIPRPTPLPTGIQGWFETFAGAFLEGLRADQRTEVLGHAGTLVEPLLCDEHGRWAADYVRLRFRALLRSEGG